MEPMMQDKRETASLIPYIRTAEGLLLFFQKRGPDARRNPDMFGMFGGGFEPGETPESAMLREIREELTYVPSKPRYFSRYETAHVIFHVFIEEVDADFESKVKVEEGEYGKFLSPDEVEALPSMSLIGKIVGRQLAEVLI